MKVCVGQVCGIVQDGKCHIIGAVLCAILLGGVLIYG